MNTPTPQTPPAADKAPVIFTPIPLSPIPASDAVTNVPTPAKGNDEVMSQPPAKTS